MIRFRWCVFTVSGWGRNETPEFSALIQKVNEAMLPVFLLTKACYIENHIYPRNQKLTVEKSPNL